MHGSARKKSRSDMFDMTTAAENQMETEEQIEEKKKRSVAMSREYDLLMTKLLKLRAVRNIRLDVQRLDIENVARELVARQ